MGFIVAKVKDVPANVGACVIFKEPSKASWSNAGLIAGGHLVDTGFVYPAAWFQGETYADRPCVYWQGPGAPFGWGDNSKMTSEQSATWSQQVAAKIKTKQKPIDERTGYWDPED